MRAFLTRVAGAGAVAAVFVAAGAVATVVAQQGDSSGASPHLEISYVTDFRDDRRLAGFADDVFVGTVVAQSGAAPSGRIPQTQFSVRVGQALKGDLSGTVVVNQQGGAVADERKFVSMEGDPMLVPGATYLFATRRSASFGNTLVPVFGDLRVTGAAEQAALVARFTTAVAQQIPFTAG